MSALPPQPKYWVTYPGPDGKPKPGSEPQPCNDIAHAMANGYVLCDPPGTLPPPQVIQPVQDDGELADNTAAIRGIPSALQGNVVAMPLVPPPQPATMPADEPPSEPAPKRKAAKR